MLQAVLLVKPTVEALLDMQHLHNAQNSCALLLLCCAAGAAAGEACWGSAALEMGGVRIEDNVLLLRLFPGYHPSPSIA